MTIEDCKKTVENGVKYDKKLINRTVFAKTYNEPILSNIQKSLFLDQKSIKMAKIGKTRILPKMLSGAVYTL